MGAACLLLPLLTLDAQLDPRDATLFEVLSEQLITGFGNDNLSVPLSSSAGAFRQAFIRFYGLEGLKAQPNFSGGGGGGNDAAITGLSLKQDNVNLTWTSSESSLYTIEESTTVEADGFEFIVTDVASSGATTEATALSVGGNSNFYTVREQ